MIKIICIYLTTLKIYIIRQILKILLRPKIKENNPYIFIYFIIVIGILIENLCEMTLYF